MVRGVLAILLVVGGTVFNVWLGRLGGIPTWALGLMWVAAYVGAAVIAWWPRFIAAARAFRSHQYTDKTGRDQLNVWLNSEFQGEVATITVQNLGPVDSFTAQITLVGEDPGYPLSIRWKDFDGDRRSIMKGETQHLQFLQAKTVTVDGIIKIGEVALLSPKKDYPITPEWIVAGEAQRRLLYLSLRISTESGRHADLNVWVNLGAAKSIVVREVVIQRAP